MLEISSGRCSQDHLYIKELDCLPEFVKKRKQQNLIDCVLSEKNTVVCFFKDGTVKKIALDQLSEVDGVDKVMKNTALFESGEVGTDGYCLTFNHSIDVPAKKLYEIEEALPLKKQILIILSEKIFWIQRIPVTFWNVPARMLLIW